MKIKKINELTDHQLSETIKIFFQTSSIQNFKTNDDKELFLYRYFGFYQESHPELFFVALHEKSDDIPLGYICGMDSSFNDPAVLELQPQLEFFSEVASTYPSHLHINISPLFHGQGIGGKLMQTFEGELAKKDCSGVHIITTPEAGNTVFYRKRGFDFELVKKINKVDLLLMGKSINSAS